MDYSVLMSVYHKENPMFLSAAIESIIGQTVKTNDFVIVCDGPLNEELDRVIDDFCQKYPVLFHVIRLDKNVGLAHALNAGLPKCRNELIARMDSDDISVSDRIEKQLAAFKSTGADIISGTVQEFVGDATSVTKIMHNPEAFGSCRVLPEKQQDIVKFAKKRSPFNHPAVMYKKSVVQACGGYTDYSYFEDYSLWVSMLLVGATGYNISDVLVYMRAGDGMYKRRGGVSYAGKIYRFKKHLKDIGFLSTKQYIVGTAGHIAVGLMPNGMRKLLYSKMLRKK